MGTTCCSLPSSTPIKIKACFTRYDLENICYNDCYVKHQKHVTFIGNTPLFKPHLDFVVDLTIGNTYSHFIKKLSQIIGKQIEFNRFILNEEIKYIRYETAYGLQVYTFKDYDKDITFNELFYDLSFVDWSCGYSLIIWFDYKLFKTNLDKAIQDRNIGKIYKLLQITTDNESNTTNNYIELEGEGDGEEDIYPFPIVDNDVYGLLSMDNALITKYLIQKMNNKNNDFCLDSNALLLCVEKSFNLCKNILIDYDLDCIFKLSPFYVIQWHATRFNENTCYLLARNGLFNIWKNEDKNILKIQQFSDHHLNPRNIEGIKRGKDERKIILISLLKSKIGTLLIQQIQQFDTGDWTIFTNVISDKS